MAKGSGLGGLLAILGVALIFGKKRKLTGEDFTGAFPIDTARSRISYHQYFTFATKPEDEVDPIRGESLEESYTTSGQAGQWLTVNGRIPTPRGTTIPMPTIRARGTRIKVEEQLQAISPPKEVPQFADTNGRRSVNLRLQPL